MSPRCSRNYRRNRRIFAEVPDSAGSGQSIKIVGLVDLHMTSNLNSGGAASLSLAVSRLRRSQRMQTQERVEQLYLELYSPVYRYLVLTGSVAEDADELTQETFLRLFRCLRAGQKVEKPKQWLISVAHNLRCDWLDRERRHPTKVALTDKTASSDPAPDPEAAALETERRQQVEKALGRLTVRQAEYLHLRAEGLKLREIADIYGITVQTVAESCARAIERLGMLENG